MWAVTRGASSCCHSSAASRLYQTRSGSDLSEVGQCPSVPCQVLTGRFDRVLMKELLIVSDHRGWREGW
jgi:hypothetical protein